MADHAFARCERFLNYHPLAKWLSIVSSVATAILYVGLIIVLGFFIDLIVERGEIPGLFQLPERRTCPVPGKHRPCRRRGSAQARSKEDVTALGFDSERCQGLGRRRADREMDAARTRHPLVGLRSQLSRKSQPGRGGEDAQRDGAFDPEKQGRRRPVSAPGKLRPAQHGRADT